MKIKLTFLFLIAAVVGSLPVKADDKTKQSQLANEKIEKAIKALGDENFTKRRKAYAILEAEKLNAIPLLLRHRLDPDTELQEQVVKLLKKAYRFEIRSFSLNKATLAEACLRLTEVSGVQVCAEGEAKQPITINLKATTFWTVVLHICRQGRVGLAPHHTHNQRMDTWFNHKGESSCSWSEASSARTCLCRWPRIARVVVTRYLRRVPSINENTVTIRTWPPLKSVDIPSNKRWKG